MGSQPFKSHLGSFLNVPHSHLGSNTAIEPVQGAKAADCWQGRKISFSSHLGEESKNLINLIDISLHLNYFPICCVYEYICVCETTLVEKNVIIDIPLGSFCPMLLVPTKVMLYISSLASWAQEEEDDQQARLLQQNHTIFS